MKKLFSFIVGVFTVMCLLGLAKNVDVMAASKPAKPKISLKSDSASVTVSISKTKNADGYSIYIKEPGDSKYKELTTIYEDGSKKRTYTVEKLSKGTYYFKVKAFKLSSGSVKWGSFSKAKKIKVTKTSKVDSGVNLKYAKQGDIVTFGTYEQDNKTKEAEPIEWIVLSREDDELLLLSKYVLDQKPYNKDKTETTWEECSLRTWLNKDFYNTAFNKSEKSMIVDTNLYNADNPEYKAIGGKNTIDKVFLLSLSEVRDTYYGFNRIATGIDGWDYKRRCAPTAYAIKNGVYRYDTGFETSEGEIACFWWLRTPGMNSLSAIYVQDDGTVLMSGTIVNKDYCGVRPAIIVSVE